MTDPEHDNMERELLDYLDGQLPADRAESLGRRLAGDTELRRLMATHEALRDGLHRLAETDIADVDQTGQRERIVEVIRREQRSMRRRRRIVRPVVAGLAAAAACVVAVTLAWTILRPADDVHSRADITGPFVRVRLHRAEAIPANPQVRISMRRLDAPPMPASGRGEGAVVAVVTESLPFDTPAPTLPPHFSALTVDGLGG